MDPVVPAVAGEFAGLTETPVDAPPWEESTPGAVRRPWAKAWGTHGALAMAWGTTRRQGEPSPYRTKSRAAIARAVMDLPPDADSGTVRRAIDQMYPFNSLQGWPFKLWSCERTRYLRQRFPPPRHPLRHCLCSTTARPDCPGVRVNSSRSFAQTPGNTGVS